MHVLCGCPKALWMMMAKSGCVEIINTFSLHFNDEWEKEKKHVDKHQQYNDKTGW